MQPSNSLLTHLETLFREVRQAVTTGRPDQWGETGRNAKGDQVKWFDLAADQAVRAYLGGRFPYPVRLWSEEGAPQEFGSGEPDFIMILDPVDGSDNFSRGLAPAGMAIALIPAHLPVSVETVQFALVGDLFTGQIWSAERGQGAFQQGQPLRTSPVTELSQAILNCDLNHVIITPPLTHLLSQAHAVRSFGAATLALVRVGDGALDAHLDLRDRLTPENFLAPALIITEAGGLITGPAGNPLPPIESLLEQYSIVAAGTPELHTELVQQLKNEKVSE